MIRRLLAAIERRVAHRLEREHAAEMDQMQADCKRVIDTIYVDFAIRLADAEARFRRSRCVDLVEQQDCGIYVHPDGQVSVIDAEHIGTC